jgi:hypothetical protein
VKRPVAMIVAGVLITACVIGGTVAAVQSGIFLNATTSIEANGEINVPVLPTASLSPNLSQPQVANDTPAEAQATETQPSEATDTTDTTASEPATDAPRATPRVIVLSNSSRAAVTLARLNEAYRLLKQRNNTYQARLKEAYNRLKATPAVAVRTNVSTPARTTPPRPTSPPVIRTEAKQHKEQKQDKQQEQQKQEDQKQGTQQEQQKQKDQKQQQRNEDTGQQSGGKDHDKDSHDASHKDGEH